MPALLDANGNKQIIVTICIPAGDTCSTDFAHDLMSMTTFTAVARPDIHMRAYVNKGTIIPEQRHLLVRKALEKPTTHLLWLDSDMRFPKDTLIRLLSHETAIVGCNYSTRRAPAKPTAGMGDDDTLLYAGPDAAELIEVQRMGMGVMLVDTDVYQSIAAPWFAIGFSTKEDGFYGEDIFFCDLAKRSGFIPYVDPVLSREVGHCGQFIYMLQHADVTRAYEMAQQTTESADGGNH